MEAIAKLTKENTQLQREVEAKNKTTKATIHTTHCHITHFH